MAEVDERKGEFQRTRLRSASRNSGSEFAEYVERVTRGNDEAAERSRGVRVSDQNDRTQLFLPWIVIVSVAVPVPTAFVAPMVTFVVAAVAGVPLISPVLVFSDRPAGSPVALYVVGEFVAAI